MNPNTDTQPPLPSPEITSSIESAPNPVPLSANPVVQNPQSLNSASAYPQPAANPTQQSPMSASQMGLNQPQKIFDTRKLIIKSAMGVLLVGGVLAGLLFTNIISLSKFKIINYDNAKNEHYKVNFYSKHSFKLASSGTRQLVSKVSNDGKFPIVFSILGGDLSGYGRLKDCASFRKVFDVQNNSLNQQISVCDIGNNTSGGQSAKDAVYVAGFTQNNRLYVITIGQDYSGIDLSSQSGAQESLTKFGLEGYKDDISTIVSSINVE